MQRLRIRAVLDERGDVVRVQAAPVGRPDLDVRDRAAGGGIRLRREHALDEPVERLGAVEDDAPEAGDGEDVGRDAGDSEGVERVDAEGVEVGEGDGASAPGLQICGVPEVVVAREGERHEGVGGPDRGGCGADGAPHVRWGAIVPVYTPYLRERGIILGCEYALEAFKGF